MQNIKKMLFLSYIYKKTSQKLLSTLKTYNIVTRLRNVKTFYIYACVSRPTTYVTNSRLQLASRMQSILSKLSYQQAEFQWVKRPIFAYYAYSRCLVEQQWTPTRRSHAGHLARCKTTIQLDNITTDLLSATVTLATMMSDLGVRVDRQLSAADHVAALSLTPAYSRYVNSVRCGHRLTDESAKTLVHAFVYSRLLQQPVVRCQRRPAAEAAVHSGCGYMGGDRSQDVRPHHSGATRAPLATSPSSTCQFGDDHTYKYLNGLAPPYLGLSEDCVYWSHLWHPRPADIQELVIRQTRTVLGAWGFAVSCAVVWNSLPTDLRVLSLTIF